MFFDKEKLIKVASLILVLINLAASVNAAVGVSIGPGATLQLEDSELRLNCLDIDNGGEIIIAKGSIDSTRNFHNASNSTLIGGTGNIWLTGSWDNQGTFIPNGSTVHLVDGCGQSVSKLTGDSTFFNFEVSTSNGKMLQTAANSSQTFLSRLELNGVPEARLSIRSSSPGIPAFFNLNPDGSQSISAVDVRDHNASSGQTLAPGTPSKSQSIDSGNTINWFGNLPYLAAIPTLSKSWLIALIVLIGLAVPIHNRPKKQSKLPVSRRRT